MKKMTSKRATELAREGIKIRKELITSAKPCEVGIYMDDNKYYICDPKTYKYLIIKNQVVAIQLVNVLYDDTIASMADTIKRTINFRNRM